MRKVFSFVCLLLLVTTAANAQSQQNILYSNEVPPVVPTATPVGSGGSCNAGAHSFAVSIVGNYGGQAYETPLSNGITATCAANDSVTVAAIGLGSGYATARNVYATKVGTTGPFYLVASNTVNNNTGTSYTYTASDSQLTTPWAPKPTPPLMAMYYMNAGNLLPAFDNTQVLGSGSFRFKMTSPFITTPTFPTGGTIYTNATSGSITVAPPTGALGTPTLTLPAATGSLGTGYFCGASLAAAGACANTALAGTFHFIYGTFLLAGNTSTITGISPAFTSSTSFTCVANDITTRANPVQAIPGSGSTVVITNTTGATDLIAMLCYGN